MVPKRGGTLINYTISLYKGETAALAQCVKRGTPILLLPFYHSLIPMASHRHAAVLCGGIPPNAATETKSCKILLSPNVQRCSPPLQDLLIDMWLYIYEADDVNAHPSIVFDPQISPHYHNKKKATGVKKGEKCAWCAVLP